VVPIGSRFNGEQGAIDFGGHGLARSQSCRVSGGAAAA
jgi:hypothetical protein